MARSKDQSLVVCGGSNTIDSSVKLFRYPTLPHSLPHVYGGHTSPVLDVTFGKRYSDSSGVGVDSANDTREKQGKEDGILFTVGGNDMCIFQWRVEGGS